MPHHLMRSVIGIALGLTLAAPAVAVPLTPPTNVNGTFEADNDVEQFEFSIPAPSIVTIETISYAGGTFATNPILTDPGGGFDPIISLFDDTGAFLADDDDSSPTLDGITGNAFDSFLVTPLAAGTYTVVITQFDNFFIGGIGDDISLGFDFDGGPSDFTSFFGCGNGEFCDFDGNNRTNFFNVNVTAEALAVPEPSTLALLGFGLVGMGLASRRRRHS
jgi:hypothetical protein